MKALVIKQIVKVKQQQKRADAERQYHKQNDFARPGQVML